MVYTAGHKTDWMHVVRAEYLEMPGLNLTKPQVQRLWGIDQSTCEGVLDALVDARFLRLTSRGGYVLARTGC
jgi:hypothetical protein